MDRLSRKDLVALLAKAIGEDSSIAVVDEACAHLGYAGQELSIEQGLLVLDHISRRDDIVGITARLAKVRARGGFARSALGTKPPPSGTSK